MARLPQSELVLRGPSNFRTATETMADVLDLS